VSSDREGHIIVAPQGNQALLVDRGSPPRRFVLGPQYDLRSTAVSPDGRWVVTGSHWSDGRSPMVSIWDGATGKHVYDLPLADSVVSQFSPDGRWLVTTGQGECQFWEVGTWHKGVSLPGGTMTFTPDGQLAAVADSQGSVRFVEPGTGRQTLRLTSPEPAEYTRLCFTPDGSRLIAASSMEQGLHIWDLRLIRRGLEEMGLGADWPRALSTAEKPSQQMLDVMVDPGPVRGPICTDDRLDVAAHTVQLAACPLNAEAYYQRGRAYGRLTESSRAIADYSAYLMLSSPGDPRRPDALLREQGISRSSETMPQRWPI
jgi:WD40 repeat protein